MDSLTLSEIADEARLIYTGYPEAAKTYRRDTQILQEIRDCGGMAEAERDLLGNCIAWGKICQQHSESVGRLAIAVATHLPEVCVELRLVGVGQRWHDVPGFDWDAAEGELRRIEAAALAGLTRPESPDKPAPEPAPTVGGKAKMSPHELALKYGVDWGALRKRLDRWRYDHDTGYAEVSNAARNEPRYLYDESAALPVIEALKAKSAGRKRATDGQQEKK